MADLESLFKPILIGKLEIKNRIVMAPLSTKLGSEDGGVTSRYIDYCVERALGGVGLIIIENTAVSLQGQGGSNPIRIDEERFIPGLHDLVDAVHWAGAKVATQLQHVGRQTARRFTRGLEPISSSPIKGIGAEMPRELSISEIKGIIDCFALAAKRTEQAGFDAVEIHGAHGYLITQFLSPIMNRRSDKYGGDLDNRMRFAIELVESIREQVGEDYPILFRFSADEHVEGGIGINESVRIAQKLEKVGVDAIDVTAGIYESKEWIFPSMYIPRGYNSEVGAAIKAAVKVPVIIVGRLTTAQDAAELVSSGKADMIALGRPLVADPRWAAKTRTNRTICPCIACNECVKRAGNQWKISCAVNFEVGRERTNRPKPAANARRILIAGGGPGGMEAARVCAERGHHVVLCEAREQLGGNERLAATLPFKAELGYHIKYLESELARLRVDIRLGVEVTREYVESSGDADVVVIATGSRPMDSFPQAMLHEQVYFATDILEKLPQLGGHVVIVGGNFVGCEIAWWLSENRHEVTIIERLPEVALSLETSMRDLLLDRLHRNRVRLVTSCEVKGVEGVAIKGRSFSKEKIVIEGDCVLIATGFESNDALARSLVGTSCETYQVGDCCQPRDIFHAVHEASRIAREL